MALVYDANDKLIKQYNYTRNGFVQTDALHEGTYKIVSMGYSDFFNDIQDINDLSASGLVANTDYLLNQVTVSEGIIAEQSVGNIPFFNESKLYYTGDKTLFSSTKTKAVLGSYFTLKTRLNFKSEYSNKVSNLKLIYNLPENCPIIEESVMIGRRTDVGYSKNNDIITIPLPINFNDSNEVRFCVLPTEVGIYKPNAYVQFDMDGKTIKQPLGIVSLEVSNLNIGLPNKTAQKSITALGIVFPNSEVILFDNDVEVGRTTSFANGGWRLNFDLVEPYSYSYHDIYAQINTPLEITLRTQNQTLTYDDSWIEVSKVTMINTAHGPHSLDLFDYEIVFDFLSPSTKPATYWYWPSYPDFTFKIDFTQNDPEKITDVVVNAITAKGKEFPLKATYDQTAKCWIATGKFDSYNLPVNVSVGYDADNKIKLDYIDLYIPNKNLEKIAFDSSNVNVLIDGNNCELNAKNGIGNDFITDVNQKLVILERFIPDTSYLKINLHEGCYYIRNYIKIDNEYCYKSIIELVIPFKEWNGFKEFLYNRNDSIYKYLEATHLKANEFLLFTSTSSFIFDKIDSSKYMRMVNFIKKNVSDRLIEVHKKFLDDFSQNQFNKLQSMRERILKMPGNCDAVNSISDVQIWLDELDRIERRFFSLKKVNDAFDGIEEILGEFDKTEPATKLVYAFNNGIVRGWGLWGFGMALAAVENNLKSYYCENLPNGNSGTPSNNPNSSPVLDPSGFVYEAVSSNLLPGVTTTCYYKTEEEDMYGDKHEVIKLWDAENYEQQNPLTTDENGFYAWDVSQGQWQVKYEKDGYDTEYSEWLPVPPPQLDVNQGMISAVAPEVKSAKGYESKIKVEFTKYMKIDSLNSNNITLVNTKDSLLKGTIILTNEEVTPGNSIVTYASKLNYVPKNELAVGDTVFLKINSEVKSYGNIPMDNDYRQMIIIRAEPKTIEAPEVINLASNAKNSVTVKVTPANAAVGQKLKAKSGSNALASITPNEITLNSTGTAQFEVSAHLAGTTYLTFALDESELRAETKVNIGMPTPKLTMPKASIDSGTTVRAGTELVLTSREFDSKIYYTLDGTSPITSSSRILYDNPINMNKNTVVKAYNFKDGFTNSDIAVFGYKVINVYNITTTVNPDSAGTVTGAGEYYENQKVELILKKNKDFIFKNWTIDNQEVSTDTIYTFNVTKNCNVVANFVGAVNSTSLLSPVNNAYRITVKPEFTWQLVQEAEHYELQIAEDPYFVHKIIDTNLLTTKYVIPNDLLKNTSYFWKVRVWSKNNSSSWSPTWNFTTEDPADVEESKSIFSISPQPVRDEAIITFNLNNINTGIAIELYDIKGTQTAEYKFTSLNEGSNKLRLDLSNIPSGIYNVIIKIGADIHRTKLLKIE